MTRDVGRFDPPDEDLVLPGDNVPAIADEMRTVRAPVTHPEYGILRGGYIHSTHPDRGLIDAVTATWDPETYQVKVRDVTDWRPA